MASTWVAADLDLWPSGEGRPDGLDLVERDERVRLAEVQREGHADVISAPEESSQPATMPGRGSGHQTVSSSREGEASTKADAEHEEGASAEGVFRDGIEQCLRVGVTVTRSVLPPAK